MGRFKGVWCPALVMGLLAAPLCAGAVAVPGGAGGVRVEIQVPPEIPLQLVNFRLHESPSGNGAAMLSFAYSLKNTSPQALVAYQVKWRTFAGNRVGPVVEDTEDRWLTGGLAPDQSEGFAASNVSNFGQQPARLVGTVTYAEFEDGSRLGPEADAVFVQLTKARRATLAAQAKWLNEFYQFGPDGLKNALRVASQNQASLEPRALAMQAGYLLALLRDQGTDAVVNRLIEASTLVVPQ